MLYSRQGMKKPVLDSSKALKFIQVYNLFTPGCKLCPL